MDENDTDSSVFSFKLTKSMKGWEAQRFSPDEPKREDLKAFWTRLKGI
jgi:hypothetical protein